MENDDANRTSNRDVTADGSGGDAARNTATGEDREQKAAAEQPPPSQEVDAVVKGSGASAVSSSGQPAPTGILKTSKLWKDRRATVRPEALSQMDLVDPPETRAITFADATIRFFNYTIGGSCPGSGGPAIGLGTLDGADLTLTVDDLETFRGGDPPDDEDEDEVTMPHAAPTLWATATSRACHPCHSGMG